MNLIPKKELDFLEFVSSKIYGESTGWWPLDLLAKEYQQQTSVEFNLNQVRQFSALYKNKFFIVSSETDLRIFPLPEIRQGIELYGSLSGLLAHKKQKEKKVEFKKSLIVYIPSIIALASLIFNITTCTHKDKLITELDILKKELQKSDSINRDKDSIIYDLRRKIIVDTINKNY